MYRVVTKAMVTHHKMRMRQLDLGPWQPSEVQAKRWAQYLEATGRYDSVMVKSNGGAQSNEVIEDDLFLEV